MKHQSTHPIQDHTKIIELISSGVSLEKILLSILTSMEEQFIPKPMYASVMLYDAKENRLENIVSNSMTKQFQEAFKIVSVGPNIGSCGTAAYYKKPVISSNIATDPLWKNSQAIIKKLGFRACWSTPILSSDNELLGTFALYFKEIYPYDARVMKIIEVYNQLAAIAIELSDETEKTKEEQIATMYFQHDTGWDREGRDILRQLNRALTQNEFEVYYQPYFGVDGEAQGMEALIRWNHPTSGLLSPAAFLGVAERTGLILQIEEWVLEKSIQKATYLRENGWGMGNFSLSVNISAQQFDNPKFVNFVTDTLARYEYNPKDLTLEITERFLFDQENINLLHKLRDVGIKISLDDFGTSYSSLEYLRDLPVDEIKIDRGFITNIQSNTNNRKIVEMIINLAHELHLTIVAEGVETTEQFSILKDSACDRFQGFLFSKPLPLNRLKRVLFEKELS